MSNSFLIKSQAFRNATLLKRDSSDICEIFKNTLQKQPKFTGKRLCQIRVFNKVAGLRPATLLKKKLYHKCFPVNFLKFLRTPFSQKSSGQLLTLFYWTLQTLLLTVSGFQAASFLKKRFRKRCFSVHFTKFLTSFGRTPPNDCFLSLSANCENFFRIPLLYSPSEKLLISCTSCRISTSR